MSFLVGLEDLLGFDLESLKPGGGFTNAKSHLICCSNNWLSFPSFTAFLASSKFSNSIKAYPFT